jgi:aldehyde:ferredoxin oxidoreductase
MYPLFFNHGTGGTYESAVHSSDASIKNWGGIPADLTDEDIQAVGSQGMDPRWKVRKYTCHTCSLGCGAIYEIKDGKYPIRETGRPEYETMAIFGSGLKSGDAEMVNWCNFLCNEYGFDTISFGASIAWAMECYENGLFTLEEMGGIDLKWGNSDAIVKLGESICKASSDIGRILNFGVDFAAEHYNRGFEYAMTAGRIEVPQHDPRRSPGLARTYKYDPTPARHVKGGQGFLAAAYVPPNEKYDYDNPDHGKRDVAGVIEVEMMNNSGFCEFNGIAIPPGVKARHLSAVLGVEFDEERWRKTGLRSYTMRHAFNLREGIKRDTNKIAGRVVGKPSMTAGPHEGVSVDYEKLADQFFTAMDWDLKTMIPSKEILIELGELDAVISDLYGE